jgi:hypothetical protein
MPQRWLLFARRLEIFAFRSRKAAKRIQAISNLILCNNVRIGENTHQAGVHMSQEAILVMQSTSPTMRFYKSMGKGMIVVFGFELQYFQSFSDEQMNDISLLFSCSAGAWQFYSMV